MYQLITADNANISRRELVRVGTVHRTVFAAYGEFDKPPGPAYISAECIQGPEEGQRLRAGPLPIEKQDAGYTAVWAFTLRMRLPIGTWRLYIEDAERERLPGMHRTIAIRNLP